MRFGHVMIRLMKRVAIISKSMGQAWLTGVWLFLIAYFAVHSFQGDSSLSALKALERQQLEMAAEAERVAATRLRLEARVAMMGGETLDPDLLEELVRKRLGFTHPDEVIVLID